MTRVKTLLVDDEPLARQELRSLLHDYPFIEICGEAGNAREALKLVEEHRPTLMFLDIAMPGLTGFELLEKLPLPHPQVIFTTAFDQFAVRAFEVNALDYLLKPVHPERLRAALEKIPSRAPGTSNAPDSGEKAPLGENDRVFVREGERCWFVPIRSIRLLEAEGNHTRIYFDREKPLLYRTLTSLEERLPEKLFLRANRSQLVNLTCIASVGQWFSGGLKVLLQDGTEVELSRRQAQIFRERTSL